MYWCHVPLFDQCRVLQWIKKSDILESPVHRLC
uniref:Uncharacterized protein n=1 Tax=Arundo donax TaxID=35708 RepID=A0A0A9H144_ARUDO